MPTQVIIPIFWRQHPGEEEAVVAEAQRIKQILRAAGLDVWVDRTHKLSPGQKLKFWEDQGVRYRVEVGPKDLSHHTCVLSFAGGQPGDYQAIKKVPKVSTVRRAELLSKLRDKLGMDKVPRSAVDEARRDPEADAAELEAAEAILAQLQQRQAEATGQATAADSGSGRRSRSSEETAAEDAKQQQQQQSASKKKAHRTEESASVKGTGSGSSRVRGDDDLDDSFDMAAPADAASDEDTSDQSESD